METRNQSILHSAGSVAMLVVVGGLGLAAGGCVGDGNLEATRRLPPGAYETLYPRESVEGLPAWQRDDVVRGDGGN